MATGFRLSAPSEYRRGVVLGLTLAEVLILLAFLLLLAMTALLLRKENEQTDLRHQRDQYAEIVQSISEVAVSKGFLVDNDRLANLLKGGAEAESLRSQLQEARLFAKATQAAAVEAAAEKEALAANLLKGGAEAESLRSQLQEARLFAKATQATAVKAAAEKEALASLLERLPGPPSEPVAERLDGMMKNLAEATAGNTNLTGQNNQMRLELARAKGNGGSGLPFCWAFPDGKAQYLLKVDMHDDGVIVRDIEPRMRPQDPAWLRLDAIARGQLMNLADFITQVAPLQARAATDRCRYSIEVVDSTGRTNKPGYKQSMGRLWTVFNIREVPR